MITFRSKWRPANRSFMPLNALIIGPFLPNHYCNPLALAICTRAVNGLWLKYYLQQARFMSVEAAKPLCSLFERSHSREQRFDANRSSCDEGNACWIFAGRGAGALQTDLARNHQLETHLNGR